MSIGLADIFASVRLNLETGQFEADAVKATDRTTAKMSGKLKKAVGGAIGAAAGMAFASAANGALELDAAMSQLQADTGMTADEAKAASKAMSGLFKGSLQSYAEIGDAMAKVHNDLGLTGDAATEATEAFLDFATATGQDAGKAVSDFDDILDAWNLTAEDAQGIMDKLIVSHQKFGGSVEDSQAALSAMAPAMQAANMSVDDGIALLNLFNSAGIDAAKAPAALAKAVKLLKPGQSLDDLIAQIGAIEDPTRRGQKAMEIFGAKSGIGLAQAIKPGMTSLDDLTAQLGDTAGATKEAADVMENSFGNRAKIILREFQGTLAEVGTSFGDLLIVASMFGPKLTSLLGTALGGLAGYLAPVLGGQLTKAWAMASTSPAVLTAASIAGGKAGLAFASGMATKIIPGIGIALAGKDTLGWDSPAAQEFWGDIGRKYGRDFGMGAADGAAEGAAAGAPEAASVFVDGYTSVLAQGSSIVAGAVDKMMGRAAGGSWASGRARGGSWAKPAGEAIPEAIGEGVLARQALVTDAMDRLKMLMENILTRRQEVARATGILTSKALAQGLKDGRPAVRQQAQLVQSQAEDDLARLIAGGGKAGKKAGNELARMLKSTNPAVRASAQRIKDAAAHKLAETKGPAAAAGTSAGNAFAAALRKAVASGDFHVNASVGFTIPGHAAGGPITTPSWVGEKGPEIYVPPAAGRILSHEDSMAAVAGGAAGNGNTYNLPITLQGALPVRTIRDIQREMERIGDLGVMPPRALSPMYRRREAASPS